jgi:hypothetical protein
VDRSGDLDVRLAGGALRWHKPLVYQTVDGKRRPVIGRFVKRAADRVAFEVGRYDKRRPLVIDPVLIYSTYLGGSGSDQPYSIAIDSAGNAYIAGTTTSTDFPGAGSGFRGTSDAFVAKLDPTGSTLVYSTYLGGTGNTNCWSITVDSSGDAYVAGDTTATDFAVVNGFGASNSGGTDAIVAKLNPAGTAVLYSTYLGGSGTDTAQSIALGANGNAYVAGYTGSTDFPATTGRQTANAGGLDGFVERIDTSATGAGSLIYSSYLGGTGDDRAFGIAVGSADRFTVTGDTTSTDFPLMSAFQATLNSAQNAFVSEFSADGTLLLYSTYLGGVGTDSGFSVAMDALQHAYVTGTTSSADFPTRNALQATAGGGDDAFVAKFDLATSGDASLIYSTFLGGSANDAGRSIAIDAWGNYYVAGDTDSTFTPFAASDAFISKIGAGGNKLLFGTVIGGSGFEANLGIAVDPAGTVYFTGYTGSTDFPTSVGALQPRLAGTLNAFVVKMPTFTKLDLNHDSQSDLLFQSASTGTLAYWTMNGDRESRIGLTSPSSPGAGWKVVGAADLNGDNNTDLIFQNASTGDIAYWLMNGAAETSIALLSPKNPGAGWKVVGTGDFNQDGYTDILFQNASSGDLYIWYLRGGTMISSGYITPHNPGAGWKVVAVGDLNGDGRMDILFQNASSGSIYVWYLHGATMFAGGFLNPASAGSGWSVAGLADLNGDGKPEIVFQNQTTGSLLYWVMSGANMVSGGTPRPANPGAGWNLVAPR